MMKFHILTILAVTNAARLGQEPGPESAVQPVDVMEAKIISELVKICKPEVFGMVECYGKGNDAVIECANCVYAGLQSEDENADCSQIEADTVTAYGTCSEVCDSSCDEETTQLLSCGGPVFCSEALALKTE